MSTDRQLYWHFLPDDGCLQFGERTKVVVGETLAISETPVLCKLGFHASRRAIDALQYAPGSLVCRVTLGGEIIEDADKVVAQQRTVVAMTDATSCLHEFACWCAEGALRVAKVDDSRCWQAIETKRKWLCGEASDEELAAAWRAARDAWRGVAWDMSRVAAWNAAWNAAWAASRAASRDAAWAASRDASRVAAWNAAWDAAWDEQNEHLEELLSGLLAQ